MLLAFGLHSIAYCKKHVCPHPLYSFNGAVYGLAFIVLWEIIHLGFLVTKLKSINIPQTIILTPN